MPLHVIDNVAYIDQEKCAGCGICAREVSEEDYSVRMIFSEDHPKRRRIVSWNESVK